MKQMINKNEITSALFWKYSERMASQIINLIVQIFLARLLEPSLFGEMAILLVFINFATLFVQSGIGTYIIQKDEINKNDISTTLIVTIIMATLTYSVLFFLAPIIECFYNYNDLCLELRVIAISLFPGAICSVYQGLLSRRMAFKTIFIRSMISIPISGAIGIAMANSGLGIWALVFQQLVNQTLTAIVLMVGTRQDIAFRIDKSIVKEILSFGGSILAQSILIKLVESLRTLIIGKEYSAEQLSYYDKGATYTDYLYSGISMTFAGVLLPTLSKVKNNIEEIKIITKKFFSLFIFIVAPLLVGFATTACNWVPIILTNKWNQAIPFIIIISASRIIGSFTTINLQVYYAIGRVDITKKIVIIECIFSIIILLVTIKISTIAIALGGALVMVIDILLFAYPNQRIINYSLKEQLIDIFPSCIAALVMSFCINLVNLLDLNQVIVLIIQVLIGIIVYITISMLLKNPSLYYIKDLLIQRFHKNLN